MTHKYSRGAWKRKESQEKFSTQYVQPEGRRKRCRFWYTDVWPVNKNDFSLPGCTVITLDIHSHCHMDKEHASMFSSLTTDNIHTDQPQHPQTLGILLWRCRNLLRKPGSWHSCGYHVTQITCPNIPADQAGWGGGGVHFVRSTVRVGLKNVHMKYPEPGFPLNSVPHFLCQWS